MDSHSSVEVAPIFVLAVCKTCRVLFTELQSEYYARHGPNQEAPYCISHDPKAEAEVITLTKEGWQATE